MKRLAILLALAPISACAHINAPSVVADKTTLDERLGIAANATYQASVIVGRNLVTAGKLTNDQRKVLDNRAYSALLAVRAAYAAGNAADYASASAQLTAATLAIFSVVK